MAVAASGQSSGSQRQEKWQPMTRAAAIRVSVCALKDGISYSCAAVPGSGHHCGKDHCREFYDCIRQRASLQRVPQLHQAKGTAMSTRGHRACPGADMSRACLDCQVSIVRSTWQPSHSLMHRCIRVCSSGQWLPDTPQFLLSCAGGNKKLPWL